MSIKKDLLIRLIVMVRRTIFVTLFMIDRSLLKRKNQIFILCYHSIASDNWKFSVNLEEFKKQINYLLKQYQIISLDDLKLYLDGKKDIMFPSVVITFDDGYKDLLAVKDFFQELKIKATLFILSDPDNANRKELDTNRAFLTRNQIMMFKKLGWTIGCHSATHTDFSKLEKTSIKKEIGDAKKNLQSILKMKIDYFSYPKGKYSKEIISAVKNAHYSLGLTMDDGLILRGIDKLLIPRIGVNGTHSLLEFQALSSPSLIVFRKLLKKIIGGFYEKYFISTNGKYLTRVRV